MAYKLPITVFVALAPSPNPKWCGRGLPQSCSLWFMGRTREPSSSLHRQEGALPHFLPAPFLPLDDYTWKQHHIFLQFTPGLGSWGEKVYRRSSRLKEQKKSGCESHIFKPSETKGWTPNTLPCADWLHCTCSSPRAVHLHAFIAGRGRVFNCLFPETSLHLYSVADGVLD